MVIGPPVSLTTITTFLPLTGSYFYHTLINRLQGWLGRWMVTEKLPLHDEAVNMVFFREIRDGLCTPNKLVRSETLGPNTWVVLFWLL